jgi:CubicO group peptidase (beta-lactamase class C family)
LGGMKMFELKKREYWPTRNWRISRPFDQEMNTEILLNAFKNVRANNNAFNSIIVIKNGYIVAEGYFHPFHKDYPVQIYSLTKTFIATLIGILIKEKKITDINQKVIDFFDIKNVANLNDYKLEMTIKDLLTSATGLEWGDIDSEMKADLDGIFGMYASTNDWGQYCFDRKVIYKPGTLFNVTSAGPQILASIIKKATGMSPHEYAREKLFKPLGITGTLWYQSLTGENAGGQGLSMTPRNLAKLGLLFLSNGYWEDMLIINPEYINEASSIQVETRNIHKEHSIIGHGFQWFMLTGLPYDTYYSFGYLGQALFCVKELDLICVTSSHLPTDQHRKKVYDLFNNYILSACTHFDKTKTESGIYNELQAFLLDIESPEPNKEVKLNNDFISTINELKYNFDQDNAFIFIENVFDKFHVKTLKFHFINDKICKLEVLTYCDHYFDILIGLNTCFSTTKVMTADGEVMISAQGAFEKNNTFKIIYYTNYGIKNSLEVSLIGPKCIECDVSNHFAMGIKKGWLIGDQ